MKIHREGTATIVLIFILLLILNVGSLFLIPKTLWLINIILAVLSFGFFVFIISFFRVPKRTLTFDENKIIAPADGKVVVIEEAVDEEYFKEKRLQISIFMSPLNVHRNLYPVSGKVVYTKYHKGKYLVAWDPKSSTDNERHSIVIQKEGKGELLVKQIAGAVARRICNYAREGSDIKQNEELGFIKFGSRVDILLPVGTKVEVALEQQVTSGVTVIASW